jgi:hypothetical protein
MRGIIGLVTREAIALTLTLAVSGAVVLLSGRSTRAADDGGIGVGWAVAGRSVGLERGPSGLCWRLEYRLRNIGPEETTIEPADLAVSVTGAVSNSAVPGHERSRPSRVEVKGGFARTATCEVLASTDEASRCRERLIMKAWLPGRGPRPVLAEVREQADRETGKEKDGEAGAATPLRVAPGGELAVWAWLEHEHPLHGPSYALLGSRAIEFQIGAEDIRDRVALDRPRPLPATELAASWPPRPPDEMIDARVFLTAPESLHLEVNVPGKQSHRFPDYRTVRPGGRVLLRFWYLKAPGTDAQAQVRVTQYRDLPRSWRTLHEGEVIEELPLTGRWARVERLVRVEPEATSLAIEARLIGGMTGDLWLDDISIDPMDITLAGP